MHIDMDISIYLYIYISMYLYIYISKYLYIFVCADYICMNISKTCLREMVKFKVVL